MVGSVQASSVVSSQISAVSHAIKDAKPDLVSIDTGSSSGAKAGDGSAGNSNFKPPSKGIDLSV
ncbi:MAG: hypothetical protein HQL69_09745 [Magnetococcales bacterium]|nr:hypothetical protein [Magnetococcales bacterium]